MSMLGAQCSPCCESCGCPSGQSLPNAVAVTFHDLPDTFPAFSPEGQRIFFPPGSSNPYSVDCGGALSQINDIEVTLPYIGNCIYAGCVNGRWVTVQYRGQNLAPRVTLGGTFSDGGFGPNLYIPNCPAITFEADLSAAPFQCSSLSFTAANRISAAVSAYNIALSNSPQTLSISVPSGYATVSATTSISGRCWGVNDDSLPASVKVEISGARDLVSKFKTRPFRPEHWNNVVALPNGIPGWSYTATDKLEFLNGVYELNYAGGVLFGGCEVHIWEYCFPDELDACGGKLQVRLPRNVGNPPWNPMLAYMFAPYKGARRLIGTNISATAAPEYVFPEDDCAALSNPPPAISMVLYQAISRIESLSGYFPFGLFWHAEGGFCLDGEAEVTLRVPDAMRVWHTLGWTGKTLPGTAIQIGIGSGMLFPPGWTVGASGPSIDYVTDDERANAIVELIEDNQPMAISARISVNPTGSRPSRITLDIKSCMGVGAQGIALAQNFQPITSVTLTRPGAGYAKLGRRAPTISVSGGSGGGATFTPTLERKLGKCDVPYWIVKSISVSNGAGYTDGEPLTITAANGDTTSIVASAVIRSTGDKTEPTLSLVGNAKTAVSLSSNGNDTWAISSVSVTEGGTGYVDGGQIGISLAYGDVEQAPAYITAVTGRLQPIISVDAYSYGGGTGAVLSPTVVAALDGDGRNAWTVDSIEILDGGTGYSEGDPIYAQAVNGQEVEYSYFYASVLAVDENGAITSILGGCCGVFGGGGGYFKSDGNLQSVNIGNGGEYYHTGDATGVDVTGGGEYYREDPSLDPIISPITVTVLSATGAGAEITASVNGDTQSNQFGQISSLTLVSGGSNYSVRQNTHACEESPFP